MSAAVKGRYPTLPNLLAERHGDRDVREEGINLMSPEARDYTRARLIALKEVDGKAERDRLYRNLLSSQPLAFSIAGHLRAYRDEASVLLGELTGRPVAGLASISGASGYELDGIEAEWFPPRRDHTNDKSGFDIACCLDLEAGARALVSIEVKYTDSFSAAPVTWQRYERWLSALGLDEDQTVDLVSAGCSQVLRQVMITDSVRRTGVTEGMGPGGRVDEAIAVVLARVDDANAAEVVSALDAAVGTRVPVQFWSHGQLFDAAREQPQLASWADGMAERYLLS